MTTIKIVNKTILNHLQSEMFENSVQTKTETILQSGLLKFVKLDSIEITNNRDRQLFVNI